MADDCKTRSLYVNGGLKLDLDDVEVWATNPDGTETRLRLTNGPDDTLHVDDLAGPSIVEVRNPYGTFTALLDPASCHGQSSTPVDLHALAREQGRGAAHAAALTGLGAAGQSPARYAELLVAALAYRQVSVNSEQDQPVNPFDSNVAKAIKSIRTGELDGATILDAVRFTVEQYEQNWEPGDHAAEMACTILRLPDEWIPFVETAALCFSSHNTRRSIARRPNCPPEVHKILAVDKDVITRRAVALHSNCPPEILTVLARDENESNRRAVATHLNCPPETLGILAGDEAWATRSAVARHPNCPPLVLTVLAVDVNKQVSTAARSNPNYMGPSDRR